MDTTLIRRTAAIFAAGLFIFILACVLLDSTSAFDDPVRYAFYELRGDELTFIAKAITNTADKIVIIALCIILLIFVLIPWGICGECEWSSNSACVNSLVCEAFFSAISCAARLENTSASSSELLAKRLLPCTPVCEHSPQAYSPSTVVRA